MGQRRTKGDGGLVQRHDHPTCPPLIDGERAKHTCKGRWVGTLNIELPNGRTVRKSYYGRTQAEAKRKLDTARRDRDTGTLVAHSPTVADFLNDWLEKKRRPPKPLKPNTWNGYKSKVNGYIIPAHGKKRLNDLRPQQIEALYDDLRHQGLAEATIRQTHAIYQKALVDAVRLGLLGRSPMDRVQPPGTETATVEQWTLEQAAYALRAAGDSARWWLAIFYGMRQGEVLGLDWRQVHWTQHTFAVEETRQNDYDYTGPILGTPKARASVRTLPMLPQIEVRLRLLWDDQGQPATGLVFPNSRGNLLDPKRDWKNWRAFIDAATVPPLAPLPYITLHAARGTAASLMEAAGIPDRVVAQILGQSQVRTTHGYQKAELARVRDYLTAASEVLALEQRED